MNEFYYHSPLGPLRIQASDLGISVVGFVKSHDIQSDPTATENPIIAQCVAELDAYFAKKSSAFQVPLDPEGTDFQKKVWQELVKIPFGKTVSYLHIAKALGDPKKIRAVGGANGKNPIAIIVPCHRVIGADGSLIGYAGGIDKKRGLLGFEGAISEDLFSI